jgi:membrane-associated phospholipid phosphatase
MGPAIRFDKTLTRYIQSLPPWIRPLMLFSTFAGNILPILMTLILIYLFGNFNLRIVVVFIGVSIFINTALKQFIHRPRPDTIYVSLMRFKTHSFPSGHAFGTITTYGLTALIAFSYFSQPFNIIVPTLLYLLIASVGVSRVYLGAHYPTDVIGGWVLGLICLAIATNLA